MSNKKEKMEHDTRIEDFFKGKTIFLTGAAGFLGTVLLELLLRCLPGISNIYILLRTKGDVTPENRKELMFKKRIMRNLIAKNPDVVKKVKVVAGDVTETNLGMSDEDLKVLIEEVTIIFHAAAVISFFKPLRHSVFNNCVGTLNVIELARKLKKLDVFVYTSSAYSNSNRNTIEENIYRLPFAANRFLDAVRNNDNDELENLKNQCKPDFPNEYTFSKCLTENIFLDMASDIPVAIVRPSIIGAAWSKPFIGYVEEGSGLVDLSMAGGKGFGKVFFIDPEKRFDLIPVDISANCHVVAAWAIGTKKLQSPLVVNNSGGPFYLTFGNFVKELLLLAEDRTLPKAFSKPACTCIKNPYLFYVMSLYEHYLPAYVFDAYLKLKGSKISLVKMYRFVDQVWGKTRYFVERTFEFKLENFNQLSALMNPREKEMFSLNLEEVSLHKIIQSLPDANDFYDFSIVDRLTPEKRNEVMAWRTRMIFCIQMTAVTILCYLLYKIFSMIF